MRCCDPQEAYATHHQSFSSGTSRQEDLRGTCQPRFSLKMEMVALSLLELGKLFFRNFVLFTRDVFSVRILLELQTTRLRTTFTGLFTAL